MTTKYWRIESERKVKGEWWVEAEDEETARLTFDSMIDYEDPENEVEVSYEILSVVETDEQGAPIQAPSDKGPDHG